MEQEPIPNEAIEEDKDLVIRIRELGFLSSYIIVYTYIHTDIPCVCGQWACMH